MERSSRDTVVSTGKAADICCVTPDAVLKWIKGGKLPGVRTAGGHYRISQTSLEPFIAKRPPQPGVESPIPENKNRMPCWEFNALKGTINPRCRQCIVYRSKSERCYVIAALGKRAGHQKLFCEVSCKKCRYFSYVNNTLKVLIISKDWRPYKLCKTAANCRVDVRFACCGDEVSMVAHQFQPDAVVMDHTMELSELSELANRLRNDSRLPDLRILFVANEARMRLSPPNEIDAVLSAPISIPELKRCLSTLKTKP